MRSPGLPHWRERCLDIIDTTRADGHDLVPLAKIEGLAQHPDLPADQVAVAVQAQSLILWAEGRAVVLQDSAPADLDALAPVERAVVVARLRAWADVLETSGAPT